MASSQGTSSRQAGSGEAARATGTVQAAADGREDLKRQLVWRMVLAGVMILALLGVLALFDYANTPDDSLTTGQQFTEPVPVRKKEPAPPVTETPPDLAAAAPAEATSDAPAESPGAAAPLAEAPPVAKVAGAAADKTVARPEPPPPPRVAATPALPPPARTTGGAAGPAATPPPAVVEAPSAAARLLSGYIVQSGLFSDLALAEQWQARLAQEGIPSSIEARLQIGPFESRAEADAARRKLKKLGIDTLRAVRKGNH